MSDKKQYIPNPCYHCYGGACGEGCAMGCSYKFYSWGEDLYSDILVQVNVSDIKDEPFYKQGKGLWYKEVFMTWKQLNLVGYLEDMTSEIYDGKESLSDYINRNRPKAEIVEKENAEMNEMAMVDNEYLNG